MAQGAEPSVCLLTLSAIVAVGQNEGVSVDGELDLTIGPEGAIDAGELRTEEGERVGVAGVATGRALDLRIEMGGDHVVPLMGIGEQELQRCRRPSGGTFAGLADGDLGTWAATRRPAARPTPTPAPQRTSAPTPRSGGGGSGSGGCPAGNEMRGSQCLPFCSASTQREPSTCACACPAATTRCGDACVDGTTDLNHCGACVNQCADHPGYPGSAFPCVDNPATGGPTCYCGYSCRDVCGVGQVASTMPCTEDPTSICTFCAGCQEYQILCDGQCVDPNADPNCCLVELDLGSAAVSSSANARRDVTRKIEGYLGYLDLNDAGRPGRASAWSCRSGPVDR